MGSLRIAITGAAGLVGQNLIARLAHRTDLDIVAFDKHPANTRTLRALHPAIEVVEADLAQPGAWEQRLAGVDSVLIGHAQIGGLDESRFTANNVTATERLLEALARAGGRQHIVHISSSVVNSVAVDWYTESKKAQESLVLAAGFDTVVLRPTLMFGWFDRKHLGWLARFMQASPVFPVPSHGRFPRQPLYAGDFCAIVAACLDRRIAGQAFNISGQASVDYIDLIRMVKEASHGRAFIMKIPYGLFHALLTVYGRFDDNAPFTTKQLAALVIPETFEVIDWPGLFGVRATPLREALMETFRHPTYAATRLEF